MRVWFEGAARAHLDMFIYEKNQWPIFGSHDRSYVEAVDQAWNLVHDHFFHSGADDPINIARAVKVYFIYFSFV